MINFDVPRTPEDYVHRIGRTGRVEAVGDAVTLMSPDEQGAMTDIERFLGKSIPRVHLPDFDYKKKAEPRVPGSGREDRGDRGGNGREGGGRRGGRGTSGGRAPNAPARVFVPNPDEASHGRPRRLNVSNRRRPKM